MKYFMLAGVGGFIGSATRYAIGAALLRRSVAIGFPLATLLINVAGSFIIGLVIAHGLQRDWLDDTARAFLIAGVLGGFTTFSAFSFETLALWRDASAARAGFNIILTVVLCLVAVWAGDLVGRAVAR